MDDVVRAFEIAAKSIKNKVYNVGSDKTVKVKTIIKYLGGEYIKIPKRPGEPDFANISKIKSELNWKSNIDIKKGIRMLLKILIIGKVHLLTPKSIKNTTRNWFKYLD